MIFGSLACACALDRRAGNRSGFSKIDAASVRNLLTDGLKRPCPSHAARTGLTASTAIKLYRVDHG
jgi:hypothetical protein